MSGKLPAMLGSAIRKLGPLGSAVLAIQLASTTRQHWQTIPSEDRERLQSLLRRSRGKPRKLVRALQLSRLVRSSVLNVAGIHRQLSRPDD
jgi:hypothetical protein